MLFMVIEYFQPGRAAEVYRRFRDRGRMAPADVRYVSSWVDLEFRRQIMEADSESALREWTRHWENLVSFEIVPVRTSAEAAAAIEPEL
jgi:predicted nucleic acid-binding protein